MSITERIQKTVRRILTRISPRLNTNISYRFKFGRKLDLKNPLTLNEKVLWLKFNTYWENDLVKCCADKYRVRNYVSNQGMPEILVDLIGAYDSSEEIVWDSLPKSFVIKFNMGYGCNIVVRDKNMANWKFIKKTVDSWFKQKYYLDYSEMQYKDAHPKILIEKCLCDKDGKLPVDYKFYCMNGRCDYVMACFDRGEAGKGKFLYFDRGWNLMPFSQDALDNLDAVVPRPDGIDDAFEYAERLSAPFPFVRTDLYIVDGKVYFGELTFTPGAGMDNGRLEETDRLLGSMLELPMKTSEG